MKKFLRSTVIKIITAEARAILRKYRPKVVAITGSVGKTSAKDAIYAVLATDGRTHIKNNGTARPSPFERDVVAEDEAYRDMSSLSDKSQPDGDGRSSQARIAQENNALIFDMSSGVRKNEKSLNSEFGVPLTIIGMDNPWQSAWGWMRVMKRGLELMSGKEPYPRLLIMEVGADHPGDIEKLASWLMPDVAVLTGVAPVHIAFFDSVDAIFKEKAQLAKHLRPEGWLVLNADDDRLRTLTDGTGDKIIAYGIDHGSLRAQNIQTMMAESKPTGIRFDIRHAAETPVSCEIHGVVGNAQVLAVLSACAVGIAEGMSMRDIVAKLAAYKSPPGRMRILNGKNGATVIDDSYNSSPAAALLALETLKQMPASRRIVALGDMRELGVHSREAHEAVGKKAAEVADSLITVGEESKVLANAAKQAKPELSIKSYGYDESARAGAELAPLLQPGDVVLVKGSQNMIRMEHFTKAIMADPTQAKSLLVRQETEWLKI